MPSFWRGSLLTVLLLLANFTFGGETGTLLGRVLKENDVPVACLREYYGGPAYGSVFSGEDGAFRIDGAAGNYTLQIYDAASHGLFYEWPKSFSLATDQVVSNFVVRLRTASVKVSGRITGTNGVGIAG